MVELSGNPEQTQEPGQVAGPVDLVIGLADPKAGEALPQIVAAAHEALKAFARPLQAVVLYKTGFASAVTPPAEQRGDNSLRLLPYAPPAADPSATLAHSITEDYRAIAASSASLDAKAYVLIASDLETVTSEWFFRLAHPIAEQNFDLVTPNYVFHKFEAILTNSILYPLTRSVYGKRIHNPLGPDFGVSASFLQILLQADPARTKPGPPRITVPVGPEAASRGLQICQANLGERKHPPVDWKNLSSLLADVLGPFFLKMERDAPIWQRVRGSEPVPVLGDPLPYNNDAVAVDIRRLLEPFQLGFRNLYEIWGLLLPPKTLFELQRLGRLPPEQFRIPDELWVRIIYDFSLGHRLRTISRDHLLRALTPLYLGWIASYALEVETMSAREVEHRIERLCVAYEAGKPYLVSRWRWPDRFNP